MNKRYWKRSIAALLLAFACLFANTACLSVLLGQEDEQEDTTLLRLVLLYLLLQPKKSSGDGCSGVASPTLASALPASTIGTGFANIKGKLVTASGAAAVAAVIMLDDNSTSNAVHYSTHSSINRDGTFAIGGVQTGTTYRLAIESLNTTDFSGRIATHIDCYLTPSSFSAGWYNGSGDTISTTAPAPAINLTNSETRDLGTIKLLE